MIYTVSFRRCIQYTFAVCVCLCKLLCIRNRLPENGPKVCESAEAEALVFLTFSTKLDICGTVGKLFVPLW